MTTKKPDKAGESKKLKAKDLDDAALDKVRVGYQAKPLKEEQSGEESGFFIASGIKPSGSFIASGFKKKS
ncbi:MAG: hypothetical protein KDJ47_13960 [Hyphomicrobiaceae bacterium]|nr:hypothetical protein [Hyphomicrobiaceae bacterium]